MKLRKVLAVAIAMTVIYGVQPPFMAYQPIISITANANESSVSFDSATGTLTLSGNVIKEEVRAYKDNEAVTNIICEKGTVLPPDCSYLIGTYIDDDTYFDASLDPNFDYDALNSWKNLISIDLSNANTSNVTDMEGMFRKCQSLRTLDLSSFDTSNVTKMEWMFDGCESITALDLSSFDTRNVAYIGGMFNECKSLKLLDLSSFETSNVRYMGYLFSNCESIAALDLSNFDTGNVYSMVEMFSDCKSLKKLDLSSFDTSNVESMEKMFYNCNSLKALDLSNFDTSIAILNIYLTAFGSFVIL